MSSSATIAKSRPRRAWPVLAGAVVAAVAALAIALLDDRQGVSFPLVALAVAGASAYLGALPLAIVAAAASLGSFVSVLRGSSADGDVLRGGLEVAAIVGLALLGNATYHGRRRGAKTSPADALVLALLHDLDLLIMAGTSSAALADTALRRLRTIVPYDASLMGTLSPEGESLTWTAVQPHDAPIALPELRGEQLARCLSAARSGVVTGYGADREALLPLGPVTWLLVGVVAADRALGLLVLARLGHAAWSPGEREVATRVAGQLAIGFEQSRLLAQAAQAEARHALAKLKEEFISHISHELRNPLTVIMAGCELLTMRALNPDQMQRLTRDVHNAALQLQTIVSGLLDMAHLQRPGWTLDLRPTDVLALIRETVAVVVPPDGRHRVEIHVPSAPLLVSADAHRLRQALANIVGNAVRYAPHGGTIRVACEEAPDHVLILVQDQGIGIPPEALEQIFEAFYRAPNELARTIPGSGLGLAITRQIVEAHGGKVWAESPGVGQGSTFLIRLPRGPAP